MHISKENLTTDVMDAHDGFGGSRYGLRNRSMPSPGHTGEKRGILSPGSVKKPPPPRRRRGQSTSPVPGLTPVSSSQGLLQSPQVQSQGARDQSPMPSSRSAATKTGVVANNGTSDGASAFDSVKSGLGQGNSSAQFENWIMVFGYSPVGLDRGVNVILQDFLRYGDIEEHDYKVGNYLFIRYRRTQEADAALSRNGRPLANDPESVIGVQRVTPELLRELGRPLQNGVISAPSEETRSGAYSSVRRYDSDINLAPQARQTNICNRLIELIFSY